MKWRVRLWKLPCLLKGAASAQPLLVITREKFLSNSVRIFPFLRETKFQILDQFSWFISLNLIKKKTVKFLFVGKTKQRMGVENSWCIGNLPDCLIFSTLYLLLLLMFPFKIFTRTYPIALGWTLRTYWLPLVHIPSTWSLYVCLPGVSFARYTFQDTFRCDQCIQNMDSEINR